jgi:hypothetical protein
MRGNFKALVVEKRERSHKETDGGRDHAEALQVLEAEHTALSKAALGMSFAAHRTKSMEDQNTSDFRAQVRRVAFPLRPGE